MAKKLEQVQDPRIRWLDMDLSVNEDGMLKMKYS